MTTPFHDDYELLNEVGLGFLINDDYTNEPTAPSEPKKRRETESYVHAYQAGQAWYKQQQERVRVERLRLQEKREKLAEEIEQRSAKEEKKRLEKEAQRKKKEENEKRCPWKFGTRIFVPPEPSYGQSLPKPNLDEQETPKEYFYATGESDGDCVPEACALQRSLFDVY